MSQNQDSAAAAWLLADLDAQITAAQAAGDRPREATAQLQKALYWLTEQDWQQSEQAFGRAAELAEQDGRWDLVAQARYAQAIALERHSDQSDAARTIYEQAAQHFAATGNPEQAAQIRAQLAAPSAPAFAPSDPERWQVWFAEITARLGRDLNALLESAAEAGASQQAQLHANRAKLAWLTSEPEQLTASLQAAVASAAASDDADLVAQIETLRRTLLSQQAAAEAGDPFSALLAQTMQTGDLPIAGDRVLQRALQALQKKEYRQVLTLAESARRNALASRDDIHYLRYLFACIFIAFARDGLGDRPGVIEILLTGKTTLEREGQTVFGRQIVELLDGLAIRWGEAALHAARVAYRRQVQARTQLPE
ncbi:MAG: hypothetical protein HC910_01875 [Spirulinaceae cyanobacterium SM2_1_0]|nr:hypothetical protein [Spirulinaceae cyanobacterium SM2_1_0]